MNNLLNMSASALTMSSREIADLVEARHNDLVATIERQIDAGVLRVSRETRRWLPAGEKGGRPIEVYDLDKRDTLVVVSGYDDRLRAKIIDRWIELEAASSSPSRLPTTAEAFASAFTILAEHERMQAEQGQAITAIETKLDRVEKAQIVLQARPANAEGITHIRVRIGKMFGISSAVIDDVMRQSPYAPKPAGMVRNEHADAEGSAYAVYWQKDITATFSRFVDECQRVTATMFTHPFVEGRFKIGSRAEGQP